MFYVIPRVTTKRKPITDTQNKSKHNTTEHHQITKEENKRGKNKGITKQSENNKMAKVSPYLSIITLNVNRLSSQIKKQSEMNHFSVHLKLTQHCKLTLLQLKKKKKDTG